MLFIPLNPFRSQGQVQVHLLPVDHSFQDTKISLKTNQEAFQYIQDFYQKLIQNGYLAASVDSIQQKDTVLQVHIYKGSAYKWARLSFEHTPPLLWSAMRVSNKAWENEKLNPNQLNHLMKQILSYYENNGYPFAKVYLDNIHKNEKGIAAQLKIDEGSLFQIDSVLIEGDINIAPTFLYNYLDIHPGDVYDERKIKAINKKILDLDFLEQMKPWEIQFTIHHNKLYLFLREKKANQIDALIGLQPNTQATDKFQITADVLLNLKNALGYGEQMKLNYQNLQYKSPKFNAYFLMPYLLGTPLGLEGSFDLYKKDTSYRKIALDIGFRYQMNANDYIKVSYLNQSNRLITPDVNYVLINHSLPNNLDIKANGVGLYWELNRTDYKKNPKKGLVFFSEVTGLKRNIIENDAITSLIDGSGFDFSSLYHSVLEQKYQYRLKGNLAYYFPISKQVVFKLNYNGGYMAGGTLFQNELFQLGGFQLLRGFDEQSIFANQYHIGTAELRFLLNVNSYFYAFSDNAYVFKEYSTVKMKEIPISFGAGLALENKTGIFNIALGLGKMNGEKFEFRRARVHFGYLIYF